MPQGRPGWERGADVALGESQACEELGLWTGVARGGGRAEPKPERCVPGRACHRRGPATRGWL